MRWPLRAFVAGVLTEICLCHACSDREIERGSAPIRPAGTGTYLFEAESGLYTEVQPGSFCLMDTDYLANEWWEVSRAFPSCGRGPF